MQYIALIYNQETGEAERWTPLVGQGFISVK